MTPAADCTFNGAPVAHEASVTAYQASLVAFGQTCASQARTCSNGTLSGSYTASACAVDSLHFADLTSGTWTIACQAGNGYASYQSRFIAGADKYVEVLWTMWDNTCTTVLYRDYQIQKITEVVETPDATGTTFTWRYDRQEDGVQPALASIADALNSNMACGHTGYVTGSYYKHVAPAVCGALVQYWLVRIERTGQVQSVFAPDTSTGNGATPQTRPTTPDRRPAYTRTLNLDSTTPNPMSPGSLRP